MTKAERKEAFDNDWQNFYEVALGHFDGYINPGTDGVKPVKRDEKRLHRLFKLLQKGY